MRAAFGPANSYTAALSSTRPITANATHLEPEPSFRVPRP